MTQLRPPVPGTAVRTVGRYELLGEVGRGGMAVVYLARQTDLDRHVALKELAAFHAADPAFVERFLRESRLTGSLNHPNIVTVYEYFEHDGTPYIAMEYFERGSLRPLVSRLSPAQVTGVLEGLLAGLAHAERHGIVHRDLKPENVMLTTGGSVKITDFGLAKALQARAGGSLTATGVTVGTPAYMAPEQALGQEVGAWTDLYAVGVMAYELLAGKAPFSSEEVPMAILLRHLNEPVPPLRSVKPDVDAQLSDWVERLLAKDGSDRPRSASEAWEELEEIVLRTLGPRWRRDARLTADESDGASTSIDGVPTELKAGAGQPTPELRARRRSRAFWLVGGLAVAAAVGVVTAIALTGNEKAGSGGRIGPADLLPAASERISLAGVNNSVLLADPRGRVLELSPASLATRAVWTDPAGPRSLAAVSDRVYVVNGEGVTAFRTPSTRPVAATRLTGALLLAGGSGAPLAVVGSTGSSKGRLCEVGTHAELRPCVNLGFEPSGVGASPSGVISVADGRSGTVVLYRRVGERLASLGPAVPVGSKPHGNLVSFRGRLFVPIERGIAVVDPQARRRTRVVRLPVTPAAIWIVPFSGRLFAALPATDRVAVFDTAFPRTPPTMVRVGRRPVAVAGALDPEGAGEAVYVVGQGDGTVTRLDPITGARLGTSRIDALGKPVEKLVLRGVRASRHDRTSIVALSLAGSGLDRSGLVVRDAKISDGQAMIELWQGGIASSTSGGSYGPLSLRIGKAPGRLTVRLRAGAGVFTRLQVERVDRRKVLIVLTEPPPTSTGSTQPTTPRTGTGAQTTTTTTVAQKPKPPKEKSGGTTTIPTG